MYQTGFLMNKTQFQCILRNNILKHCENKIHILQQKIMLLIVSKSKIISFLLHFEVIKIYLTTNKSVL